MALIESNINEYFNQAGTTKELIFIDRDNPEFNRMFSYFPDKVMENKLYSEILQYMGTVIERDKIKGSILQIYHQFRHRALPETNERKYWNLLASNFFVFNYVTTLEDF